MSIYINKQGKLVPLAGREYSSLPIGTVLAFASNTIPDEFLLCDGSEFDTTEYPDLYRLLGTNKVPDYRECVLVGVGENTTNTIANHDTYTLGQFKDDQLQDHYHKIFGGAAANTPYDYYGLGGSVYDTRGSKETVASAFRSGTTTHGKQKGVNYIIKATPSASADVSSFATKGYIQNQNILSDYELPAEFTNGGTGPLTMPYDGYISVSAEGMNLHRAFAILINGLKYVGTVTGQDNYENYLAIETYARKGDVITLSDNYSSWKTRVRYYKLRDYSDR